MTHPTAEQLQSLEAYAKRKGPSWKSFLLADWQQGRCEGYLQQLRNQFGPAWLTAYQPGDTKAGRLAWVGPGNNFQILDSMDQPIGPAYPSRDRVRRYARINHITLLKEEER